MFSFCKPLQNKNKTKKDYRRREEKLTFIPGAILTKSSCKLSPKKYLSDRNFMSKHYLLSENDVMEHCNSWENTDGLSAESRIPIYILQTSGYNVILLQKSSQDSFLKTSLIFLLSAEYSAE